MTKATVLFAALLLAAVAQAADTTTATATTTHTVKHMDCSKMTGAKQTECMAKADAHTDTTGSAAHVVPAAGATTHSEKTTTTAPATN